MKEQINQLPRDDFQQLLEAMRTQNELYKQVLAGLGPMAKESNENRRKVLKFSKKEILQMPTNYRNVFATNDMIVHYRLRKDGVYEARFHRNGIDIEVSSKDLTKLKQKFIEKLNNKDFCPRKKRDPNEKTFAQYAAEWLNIKRVTTKQSTYNEYVRMLNRDVLPVFGKKSATEIDRSMLQNYLLTYVDRGTLRMAHKLFLLLRCIFDMIAEDYNIPTPMMKRMLPYIEFEKAKRVNLSSLHTAMKRLFPEHHSHELRHTFISRCKESGVLSEVVSIWAGHSLGGTITTTVYTHYSDEFFLKEAEKVDYLQWEFGEE